MAKLADPKYAASYSENGLSNFLTRFAKKAGQEFLILLFKLYYVMADGKASPTTIALILAALGYTVSPIDLVPDVIPVVGLSDDAAVLAATVTAVSSDITPEITRKAERRVDEILS